MNTASGGHLSLRDGEGVGDWPEQCSVGGSLSNNGRGPTRIGLMSLSEHVGIVVIGGSRQVWLSAITSRNEVYRS
jgi:hypothetical protein